MSVTQHPVAEPCEVLGEEPSSEDGEFDPAIILELVQALGRQKARTLYATCKQSFDDEIDALRRATRNDDQIAVGHMAHKICGSVGAFGLVGASRLAATIEQTDPRIRILSSSAERLARAVYFGFRRVEEILHAETQDLRDQGQ